MEPVCEYLNWDSDFFGDRIARLTTDRIDREIAYAAERWCGDNQIDCLYFLARLDDPDTFRTAQAGGYQLVDVRVTWSASISGCGEATADSPGALRPFQESDLRALREIAKVSHRDSRFYADPRFPGDACDRLYETWIERSCHGWADAVFVADMGLGPVGYATAHRDTEVEGRLGLIAVDAGARGRGLGRLLVKAVLDWGRRERLQTVRVVTQGRNSGAMRLYGRCGFLPHVVQLWYHRWFDRQPRTVHNERP